MPENLVEDHLEKKEKLENFVGVWLPGTCGNSPAFLINPEFYEDVRYYSFVEFLEKNPNIQATVKIGQKSLINRISIQGIKSFCLDLLTKINQEE